MEREVESKSSYIDCRFKLKYPVIEEDSPSMPYEFTCVPSQINFLKVLKRQFSNGNIGVAFNWFDTTKEKTQTIEFVYKKWDSNNKCSDKEIKMKQQFTNEFLDYIENNELDWIEFHLEDDVTRYSVKQVIANMKNSKGILCSLRYDLR